MLPGWLSACRFVTHLGWIALGGWFGLSCANPATVPSAGPTATPPAPTSPGDWETVFGLVWNTAKNEIYDTSRAEKAFTEEAFRRLSAKARQSPDLRTLAHDVLNPFLGTLGISHTHLYTRGDLGFAFLRSLFSTREIDRPKIQHIGVQLDDQGRILEVLDGYPAAQAGMRRGDSLIEVEGRRFVSLEDFSGRERAAIRWDRRGRSFTAEVPVVNECPHASFLHSMERGARIIERFGKKLGYVRLWCGTSPRILERFQKIVREQFPGVDGLILDLRGGFGGAWYEYLDPFYQDRSTYFQYAIRSRDGRMESGQAEPHMNESPYTGPMVVLINEGTRSGKEALAYQFKKDGRAKLIGTRSQGAFSAGKGVFAEKPYDFLLLLAVAEFTLDGNKIEGVGIEPDQVVPYPLEFFGDSDPQLEAAITILQKLRRPLPAG